MRRLLDKAFKEKVLVINSVCENGEFGYVLNKKLLNDVGDGKVEMDPVLVLLATKLLEKGMPCE